MKTGCLMTAAAVIVSISLLGTPVHAAKCDRQCLVRMMPDYLVDTAKHDPKAVPFAADVKFTENSDKTIERLQLGKGLWQTASAGPSNFAIYAADPKLQSVACLAMMKENDKDIYLGARLKLEKGKIAEAEHIVFRGSTHKGTLEKPRRELLEDVPKNERMKHDQLAKIGTTHDVALTGADGTLAPMAKDCERHGNGMITAGGNPVPKAKPIPTGAKPNPEMEKIAHSMAAFPRDGTGQTSTGTFAYITEGKPRRMVVADEQKGLAVGFSMSDHTGDLKVQKFTGVPGITEMPAPSQRFNPPAVHFFKIRKGQLHEMEAIGVSLPYGTLSGWETPENMNVR
jgi:hypothetical protein